MTFATLIRHRQVEPFLQMQNTAHFAGESAGASGFQAPCIVLLDVLMGVDHSRESEKLQEARSKNLDEMHPKVLRLIYDKVGPSAPLLRDFILAFEGTSKGDELRGAFRGVLDELVMWRSSHRARAVQWLASSTVTTGRTAEDVDSEVAATFRAEMDEIIQSTKEASDIRMMSSNACRSPSSGASRVKALVKSLSNTTARLARQMSLSTSPREGPAAADAAADGPPVAPSGAGDEHEEVHHGGGDGRIGGGEESNPSPVNPSGAAKEEKASDVGSVQPVTVTVKTSGGKSGCPVFQFPLSRRSRLGK